MRAYCLRRQPGHHEAARLHPSSCPSVLLLVGLAVGLGGCSSSFMWVKDGFSAQHAEARYASCQLEAERLRHFSSESDEEREARIGHEAGLCMKADGWQRVELSGSPAGESASEEPGQQGRAHSVSLGSGRGIDPAKEAAVDPAADPQDPEDEAADPASSKTEDGGDDEEDGGDRPSPSYGPQVRANSGVPGAAGSRHAVSSAVDPSDSQTAADRDGGAEATSAPALSAVQSRCPASWLHASASS